MARVSGTTRRAITRIKDRLREGAVLMKSNSVHGPRWYLLPLKRGAAPGREVSEDLAQLVLGEPEVYGARDGMWPGCDQVYRIGEPS